MLHESNRTSSSRVQFKRYQRWILGFQVGIAFMVLSFTASFVHHYIQILNTDLGFESKQRMTVSFRLPDSDYDDSAKKRFIEELRADVGRITGVEEAAVSFYPPLKWGGNSVVQIISDHAWNEDRRVPISAIMDSVSPEIFEALGMHFLDGQNFSLSDLQHERSTVVLDQRVAESLFGERSAIGERVAFCRDSSPVESISPDQWFTVVGVVNAVHRNHLLNPASQGTVYFHYKERLPVWISLVVKSSLPENRLLDMIRESLSKLDSRIAIARPESMGSILRRNYSQLSHVLSFAAFISGLVLLLCVVGLIGMVHYVVSCQTKEIGIKMSLGGKVLRLWWETVYVWLNTALIGISGSWIIALIVAPRIGGIFEHSGVSFDLVSGSMTLLIFVGSRNRVYGNFGASHTQNRSDFSTCVKIDTGLAGIKTCVLKP